MGRLYLTDTERNFFDLVSRAVLANPFSHERDRIDRRIGGLMPGDADIDPLAAAIGQVRSQLSTLAANDKAVFTKYASPDRDIMRNALLFDLFHRNTEPLDALIAAQVAAEERSEPVPFARAVLAELTTVGFSEAEALRMFGLFFQLRRAFYFINTAIIGRSQSMRRFRESLWNNVFTCDLALYQAHLMDRMEDFATLLLGETGTGKGTAATAIGRSGLIPFDPATGRFVESFMAAMVPVNVSQFPESLIESELFGHRKGAFTGAIDHHDGLLSRCSPNGAVFLDEIGEVAAPIQTKLLKVLEERQFSPVGSHKTYRFQGRVIAATNRPLAQLREPGRLRDDFFYRLCSDLIEVPPLRVRIQEAPEELNDLLAHVIARIVGHPAPGLVGLVRDVIRDDLGDAYPWPGNVRELAQCVRRILLNRRYATGGVQQDAFLSASPVDVDLNTLDAQGVLQYYCHRLYTEHGSYERVARQAGLDRRTVKKHILGWEARTGKG